MSNQNFLNMNELLRLIVSFSYRNGKDRKQVFSDLLKYIIGFFSVEREPDPSWKYTKEQNNEFHKMMKQYLSVMTEKLKTCEWYDAWGDLFMELTPKGGYKGQFFTPTDICNLMAESGVSTNTEPTKICGAFGKRVTISDPAAGSSRNLLAAHVLFVRDNKRKPFLVAEDVDIDCCRMSAINLMVHGCYGEVICHNTLTEPKELLFGYIVNEGMYPMQPGMPTIRKRTEPEYFVSLR